VKTLTIECLSCGETRTAGGANSHLRDECPRCGYLGWAESESLTEALRRLLRERPLELRRLQRVAT
jgi:phage FluMu protein Com